MKKTSFLIVFITILLVFLTGCSKYPNDYPTLNIKYNNTSYEADINDGTWMKDKFAGNSFDFSMPHLKERKEIESIDIPCNSIIDLDLSFVDDIQKFNVYLIKDSNSSKEIKQQITCTNYTVTMPSQKGTYSYLVEAGFDDAHIMNYIFTIVCD